MFLLLINTIFYLLNTYMFDYQIFKTIIVSQIVFKKLYLLT